MSDSIEPKFEEILKAKREYYGYTEAAIQFAAEEYARQILLQSTDWQIEYVDRYYYASGRNHDTYVETTYWYKSTTTDRKETSRTETIQTGSEWNLPEWAKGITCRRKSLESDF